MGDAPFVLISIKPLEYLLVSAISLVAAVFTEYAVDALTLDGGFKKRRQLVLEKNKMSKTQHDSIQDVAIQHVGHEEGDSIDVLFHHSNKKKNPDGYIGLRIILHINCFGESPL